VQTDAAAAQPRISDQRVVRSTVPSTPQQDRTRRVQEGRRPSSWFPARRTSRPVRRQRADVDENTSEQANALR
jgi:hypothetical protein